MASGSGEPNAAVAEDGKSKEDKPQASVYCLQYKSSYKVICCTANSGRSPVPGHPIKNPVALPGVQLLKVLSSHLNWGARLDSFDPL